jgi:hypothetical protein
LEKAISDAMLSGKSPPTELCVVSSVKVLKHLDLSKMTPHRIGVDQDGSVGIYFFEGDVPSSPDSVENLKSPVTKGYARFSVSEDGSVVANIKTPSWRDIWFVGLGPGALDLACGRIRRSLNLK